MAQTINTRLVLRNANLSAWEESSVKLLKGEMALAKQTDGTYKVRIGTGDKTWNELSDQGQLVIPAANVEGLNQAIAALSTSYYEDTDITNLSTETKLSDYVEGDIAVIKKDIDGTHTEYTAYRFSKDGTKWMALDGNYSAENVYFPKDMVMTYAFGKHTVPTSGSYTLSCKGQSVQEMINDAFAQVQSGTKTNPTFTFKVNGGTGEIGTKYTVPAATLTMTGKGSYQYGPTDTGITVPVSNAVVKALKTGYTQELSNTTAMTTNSTLATTAGTSNAETYLSGGSSYTYHAEAYYTEGATPKNNIGADDPDNKIAAGSYKPTDITATFTGYYPSYYGFSTTPTANPTAITANNSNTIIVDGVSMTRELNTWSKTSFTSSSKWYELFYIVPAVKRTSSGWTGKDSNNVDLAVDTRSEATVTFLDGTTAKYYVYVVRNAAQYSATTCTMSFK